MTELPSESWEMNEEDEAYMARLSESVAQMKVADYLATQSPPLIEKDLLLEREKGEFLDKSSYIFNQVMNGYKNLYEGLGSLLEEMDLDEASRVRSEYDRWISFLLSMNAVDSFLNTVLSSGKTLQEAFFLSNESMSVFYQVAKNLLRKEEFKKSGELFFLLSKINPFVYEFWLGLALSMQALGDYERAIEAYQMGRDLNGEDPTLDLFLADCFVELNVKPQAETYLNTAKEKIAKNHEYATLKPKYRQVNKRFKTLS